MGGDVRLVQCGCMNNRIGTSNRRPDEVHVTDRAGMPCKRARSGIEPDGLMTGKRKRAHQGFAQMAGASRDEDFHRPYPGYFTLQP